MPLLQLEYKVGRVSSTTFGTRELAIHINLKSPKLLSFSCRINVATKWGRTAWWAVDVLDMVAEFQRLRVNLQPTSGFFVKGGLEIDRVVVWEDYGNILVVCSDSKEKGVSNGVGNTAETKMQLHKNLPTPSQMSVNRSTPSKMQLLATQISPVLSPALFLQSKSVQHSPSSLSHIPNS